MTVADEAHVKSDLIATQLDVARLQAALSDSDDPQGSFHPPESASSDLIVMQRHFLAKQVDEFRAKLASLDSQRAQKEAENFRLLLRSLTIKGSKLGPKFMYLLGQKNGAA